MKNLLIEEVRRDLFYAVGYALAPHITPESRRFYALSGDSVSAVRFARVSTDYSVTLRDSIESMGSEPSTQADICLPRTDGKEQWP